MPLRRTVISAAGAVAAVTLPFVVAPSPAAALEGDEHASTNWTQTFEDTSGATVSCSLVAEATVDRDGEGFSATVQLRLVDDDATCQEPFVQLTVSSIDASGDPQEARSSSFDSTQVTLTATDVADDVRATVFVAFPICRPTSSGCSTTHELRPK